MHTAPQFQQLPEGTYATVTSPWSQALEDTLLNSRVDALELNTAKGWRGNSVDFLRVFPHLRVLIIIDHEIQSIDAVNTLSKLAVMQLETYSKSAIDLSNFPGLVNCNLQWRPKYRPLSACVDMLNLFIDHYPKANLEELQPLSQLEKLGLVNASIKSLRGITSLQKLKKLRLGNLRGLTSLSGIEALHDLEILHIGSCRNFANINEVAALTNLRIISISNCGLIDSLKPLANLKSLREVYFVESTDIRDSDLSPLIRPDSPLRVSFQNRKHYSHRREQIDPVTFPPG
jgi:internalin A